MLAAGFPQRFSVFPLCLSFRILDISSCEGSPSSYVFKGIQTVMAQSVATLPTHVIQYFYCTCYVCVLLSGVFDKIQRGDYNKRDMMKSSGVERPLQ